MKAQTAWTEVGVVLLFSFLSTMPMHCQLTGKEAVSATEWLANTTRPVVIAHRGCWQFAPENSLSGIRSCIRLGADLVEGDVRTTKDGVLVLMHDPTLDRMTNKAGAVSTCTYQELKQARLRDGSGGREATLTNEAIPTLVDALRTAKGHLFLLLHINDADVNRVFDAVAAEGAKQDVVFLWDESPDSPALGHAKFVGQSAFIPIIVKCTPVRTKGCYSEAEFRAGKAINDYRPYHPVGYLTATDDNSFLKIAVEEDWGSRFKVMANEGEDRPEEVWAQYLQWRVPMILTDHAKALIEYLKRKGVR